MAEQPNVSGSDSRSTRTDILFEPFRLGTLALRNRVVMAPMTREMSPGGVPNADNVAYYARRASGGIGLILTEGTRVCDEGSYANDVPRIYGDDALEGWKSIVDAVHAEGAAIFSQLWHVGGLTRALLDGEDTSGDKVRRISPSSLVAPGCPAGETMNQKDIDGAINAFAKAAKAARVVGFDGIEIHGAHSYLPDQFFWHMTNLRTDEYGGSLSNRARFAAEVIKECKRAAGDDFPVSIRISQWKLFDFDARVAQTPQELEEWLGPLVDAGVDMFHVSTRRFWAPAFEGSDLSMAAWTRKVSGRPVIAVGSVTLGNDFKSQFGRIKAEAAPEQIELIAASIDRGDFDLIAIGRAILANADWVRRVRDGQAHRLETFTKEHLESLV